MTITHESIIIIYNIYFISYLKFILGKKILNI